MGVKWTPEQESAVIAPKDSSLDNQTLLVAAAAGSGKTAVLVERIWLLIIVQFLLHIVNIMIFGHRIVSYMPLSKERRLFLHSIIRYFY